MAMTTEMKNDLYKTVTTSLIEQMENGVAIWQKPWVTSKAHQPRNGHHDRAYNGFNRIYLGMLQESFGSNDPRWFTFDNIKDLQRKNNKIKLRKGSKATIVIYNGPSTYTVENDEGEPEERTKWRLIYYRVYHASMIENLDEYQVELEHERVDDIDMEHPGIESMRDWCDQLAGFSHGGTRACYIPSEDAIRMPSAETFKKSSWYAQTLAHEIIHATGHESRINRLERTGFGTSTYAKEELIAEFGAAMMLGSYGIPVDMEQSAAYMKEWAKACKEDPMLLVSAANAAEYAAEYVMQDEYAVA